MIEFKTPPFPDFFKEWDYELHYDLYKNGKWLVYHHKHPGQKETLECYYGDKTESYQDNPSLVDDNGVFYWHHDGHYHRENGPAVIIPDKGMLWYQHGELHRLDGPAVIWSTGATQWFVNGKELTEQQVRNINYKNKINKENPELGQTFTDFGLFEKNRNPMEHLKLFENFDLGYDEENVIDASEDNEENSELINAISDMVKDTVGENKEAQNEFIETLRSDGLDGVNLEGFIQDSDIYDFYLQYQFEIDQKLAELGFFEQPLAEWGVNSLYGGVINGTQQAVEAFLREIYNIEDKEPA